MATYRNSECDRCGKTCDVLHGRGPEAGEAWGYDVVAFCEPCLEEMKIEREKEHEEQAWDELYDAMDLPRGEEMA